MMFDPPDFEFKELSDSLRDQYDPDGLLLPKTEGSINPAPHVKSLAEVTEQMISSVENQLSFNSNDSGRYFNLESEGLSYNNMPSNAGLYVIQPSDNLFNDEPTLLDENTVNQFFLPLQTASGNNTDSEIIGPDLLALHSCVICHDIFTTDADLLDHTISMHASVNFVDDIIDDQSLISTNRESLQVQEPGNNNSEFEAEWLVCSMCQRVLSTALEVEPSEQLCCSDSSGKSSVSYRKLQTMFVCDFCSGLFADDEALDNHRLSCYTPDQQNYYADRMVGEILKHAKTITGLLPNRVSS